MIDIDKLNEILTEYKKIFKNRWNDEKYKWQAIKHFQSHWNIEAANFGKMFEYATSKTANLLTSKNFYPREMIINFAKNDDEIVRQMFRRLFNKNEPLSERIELFQDTSETLIQKYDEGTVKNQDSNNMGNVAGVLLYAKTTENITPDFTFNIGGNQIQTKTLDLNTDFTMITKQLDDIAFYYFGKCYACSVI